MYNNICQNNYNIENKNKNYIQTNNCMLSKNNINQNNNYNQITGSSAPAINSSRFSPKEKYYFPVKGLFNIGSSCYMNATLQCLLHINELIAYFLNEYPKDSPNFNKKNKDIESQGNLSKAFYDLANGVLSTDNVNNDNNINMSINQKTKININPKQSSLSFFNNSFGNTNSSDAYSPDEFKRVLGYYNPQFRSLEANDSKDLILYLLQTMHEELNYYGDVTLNRNMIRQPNQLNRPETFLFFNKTYNMRNFSIISTIFYGTYENITFCKECKNYLYNFQKFEFISFGLSDYHRKPFNIYQGFKDNQKEAELKGDNQFYCSQCKKLCNASLTCSIIQPPNKLLINLDYGKNK